jgi:hypothetical protein
MTPACWSKSHATAIKYQLGTEVDLRHRPQRLGIDDRTNKRGMQTPETPDPVMMGATEPGMERLRIDLGRQDGLRPMDVVGAIANEAKIPGKRIGQIEILDHTTFVDVPARDADRVVNAMRRARLRGRPALIERAAAS